MKIFSAQVKAARFLLKITQPELAKATGVSEKTMQTVEADAAVPKPARLSNS